MKFLSKLFIRITLVENNEINAKKNVEENDKKTHQKQQMTDGYPVTMTPFVPEIMEHAIVQKKITSLGRIALGFTFSSEKSNLVSIECLEMIRKNLLEIFVNYPEIMKELEKPIPSNAIAVSFSQFNFELGESCQNFIPVEKFNVPDDAFYTYQKLSENLQATFYNENGTQFLSGLCYYPEPYGKQIYLKNDEALSTFARGAAEAYPLQDREKMYKKITYNRYGRDCGTAGKRVLVDCSGKQGVIRHAEYDHFSNKWTYTPCDECLKDAFTYKWKALKMEVPKPADDQKPSNATEQASELPTAPPEKNQEAEQLNLMTVIKFLEMFGIPTSVLNMLNRMSTDTKIPMIHKATKVTLPESVRPQFKDLITFLKSSPDWCIDLSSLKEGTDNGSGTEAEETKGSAGGKMDLKISKNEDSEVTVTMDSPTLSRTTTNLDAMTSSALSETPSSASSTENLLEDFDKVEDATERDNEIDAKIIN